MLVTAYRGRTKDFTVTVKEADGTTSDFVTCDVMRVKIGRVGAVPILDLDSAAPSANNSNVTPSNPAFVRLDQNDLKFTVGFYTIEVGIVDDSDYDKFKHAESGTFHLVDTMLGDVGLT